MKLGPIEEVIDMPISEEQLSALEDIFTSNGMPGSLLTTSDELVRSAFPEFPFDRSECLCECHLDEDAVEQCPDCNGLEKEPC